MNSNTSTKMNAAIAEIIKINRQNRARTLIADRDTMTGITSDDQHVEFCRVAWAWINVDTGARVEIGGGKTWIDLEAE